MGPIVKIKKLRGSSNDDNAEGQARIKRIKLKNNASDQPKQLKQQSPQPAGAAPTKIKLTIKKKDAETSQPNEVKQQPVKLKLNLKKDTVNTVQSTPAITKAPKIRVKPPRIPGEGYDSEASDIEEDPLLEEGVILRVLPDIRAEFVKNSIESGDYSGISIKWKGERHAIVKINGYQYGAVLVNLPTIIEVNKCVDRKNLLKTFDVSQMLLCVALINKEEEVFDLSPPDTEDLVIKHFEAYKDEIMEYRKKMFSGYQGGSLTDAESKHLDAISQKAYDYRHGITPPLYSVRNRRFRRRMVPSELDYVEKTVELLLKQDGEAEEFSYELVDEESLMMKTASNLDLAQYASQKSAVSPSLEQVIPKSQSLETNLFDERSDHDDHEDLELELEQALQGSSDQEDKDANEYANDYQAPLDEAGDEVEQDNGEEEDDEEDDDDDDDDDEEVIQKQPKQEANEDVQHNELLKDELRELESILQQNIDKLSKTTNPLLKSRFVDSINKLEKEVEIKRKQLLASEETLQNSSSAPEAKVAPTARPQEEPDEEEDEEDDEDDDEEDEEEDEEERQENVINTRRENTPAILPATEQQPPILDGDEELDQDDMDMMMLFGVEGDE